MSLSDPYSHPIGRRHWLRNVGLVSAAGLAGAALTGAQSAPNPGAGSRAGWLDVRDFGARGDGRTDDTAAIQAAIDAGTAQGGAIVFLPAGQYLVADNLVVKPDVVIEGVFRTPSPGDATRGSVLLAMAGKGRSDGPPFIALQRHAVLSGLTVFYPEQTRPEPTPYPWTVAAQGDDVGLRNVLLLNPWQAVNLQGAGRHFIHGLYGHPLYRGLHIDAIFDVGRIDQVHFWPFWGDDPGIHKFTINNLVAFTIGRTDWQYMANCFTIFAKVGFHFIRTKTGLPNGVFTTCGADICPTGMRVDEVGAGTGVSFVNSQFMAGIEVAASNRGQVKLTACGFWGLDKNNAKRLGAPGPTRSHAVIRGTGHVSFNACHFHGWDRYEEGDPCLDAVEGGLTVNGCEFGEPWPSIRVGSEVEAAIITANRFVDVAPVPEIHAPPGRVQMGLNVSVPRAGRKRVKT